VKRWLAFICASVVLIGGTGLDGVQGQRPRGETAIRYRLSFPEPQHHWMQVEATFPSVDASTLELRMSRASPGRYSLHDFAKNVYDVHAFAADGRELQTDRPDPSGWAVSGHGGSATVKYKVFGDRVDGTYLAIDTTHAHINMPAAIMWARGFDDRPIRIEFVPPPGKEYESRRDPWHVMSQLPGSPFPDTPNTVHEYFAPNLQYLMDSPVEFAGSTVSSFNVNQSTFRFALHSTGTEAEFDSLMIDVEKIVRQEGEIFGEYPTYEPGSYTFLADYLPYANGDGMEHRNSTVITGVATIAGDRMSILDTVAHEFFHCWNVERIRPKSLEPFDFDRANISGELWLAEGFTQYYGPLALHRAGLMDVASTAATLTGLVEAVSSPGHLVRSAEEMSRMAAFIDGGRAIDKTNWSITNNSYYPVGGAIALALDLTLRDRSDGRLSLDDFMRAMWRTYGKPGGARPGYVDRPYTMADAEETLASVSGDRAFAHDFFARFIQGTTSPTTRACSPARDSPCASEILEAPWLGDVRLNARNGARVANLIAPTWPAYRSGLDEDDELHLLDGRPINGEGDLSAVLRQHNRATQYRSRSLGRTGKPTTSTGRTGRGSAYRDRSRGERWRLADRGAESVPTGVVGSEVMAFPWLQVLDAVIGVTDLARSRKIRKMSQESGEPPQQLEAGGRAGLGGPRGAARGRRRRCPEEAFERDTHRLELEREQLEAERLRAERALALELRRQASDREIGRCDCSRAWRWPAGSGRCSFRRGLLGGPPGARAALGIAWLLLLARSLLVRRAVAGRGVGEPA
jgi:predicted metalloprotease with PDZ domain